MSTREDVTFDVGGLAIGGWPYTPEGSKGPRPAISMAHGFAGIKDIDLPRTAEVFADARFVVVLHDHPTFGVVRISTVTGVGRIVNR